MMQFDITFWQPSTKKDGYGFSSKDYCTNSKKIALFIKILTNCKLQTFPELSFARYTTFFSIPFKILQLTQ